MNGLFSWTPALTGVVCLLTSSVARAAGDGDLARMQDELNRTKTELAATRAELGSTRDALSRLADKVASLEAARGSGAAAAPGAAAQISVSDSPLRRRICSHTYPNTFRVRFVRSTFGLSGS